MKIGIIGTGTVGQVIARKFANMGHDVIIGTRDVAKAKANTESNAWGVPGFGAWYQDNSDIKLATFDTAAKHGDIIINATSGMNSLEALTQAGADNIGNKILIDIANPLDFSKGFPPSLSIVNTDSLGEAIQRAFPAARIVKTFNTMNADVMVDPSKVPGKHSIFVSGNDQSAKDDVKALLRAIGWEDIIDMGDITTARGTEQLLPIWVRLFGVLGHANFNFAIVRN